MLVKWARLNFSLFLKMTSGADMLTYPHNCVDYPPSRWQSHD
jgi:hypothetical protein